MTQQNHAHVIRFAALKGRDLGQRELILPTPETLHLAQHLGLVRLTKARLRYHLHPVATGADWMLQGQIGATVTQPCVVTGEDVTTRIDAPFARRFLAHFETPEGGGEYEMHTDDTIDPLPETLNLYEIFSEVLALELPPYPRKEGAQLEGAVFTAPDIPPMSDRDASPFAALKYLQK